MKAFGYIVGYIGLIALLVGGFDALIGIEPVGLLLLGIGAGIMLSWFGGVCFTFSQLLDEAKRQQAKEHPNNDS